MEGMESMEGMEWTFVAAKKMTNDHEFDDQKKWHSHNLGQLTVLRLGPPKTFAWKWMAEESFLDRKKSMELCQPLDIQGHLLRKSYLGATKNIAIQAAFTSGGIPHNV